MRSLDNFAQVLPRPHQMSKAPLLTLGVTGFRIGALHAAVPSD